MCDDLGSFIYQKRVEKITMRKLAGMLDVPVTYLCDVEKNRCRIKDRLALLAEILALSDEEKIRMFELAENASVDTDLSGYEMLPVL